MLVFHFLFWCEGGVDRLRGALSPSRPVRESYRNTSIGACAETSDKICTLRLHLYKTGKMILKNKISDYYFFLHRLEVRRKTRF